MCASFYCIRRFVAVEISDAYTEFGRREFGQIMYQSLLIEAASEAAAGNVILMFAYSLKMSEKSLCECH